MCVHSILHIIFFSLRLSSSYELNVTESVMNQLVVLTFAYVPACVLNGGVAVDIGKQTETESVLVIGWVRKAIYQDTAG